MRQNIRCIGQSQLSSGDKVSRFSFGGDGCFGSPPPPPPPPPAPASASGEPQGRSDGFGAADRGRWRAQKCLAQIAGPVARTENFVDGKLNDTQVYSPVGVCVGHAELRQRRASADRQGLQRGEQRDRHRHGQGDGEQPQPAAGQQSATADVETSPGVVVPSGSDRLAAGHADAAIHSPKGSSGPSRGRWPDATARRFASARATPSPV